MALGPFLALCKAQGGLCATCGGGGRRTAGCVVPHQHRFDRNICFRAVRGLAPGPCAPTDCWRAIMWLHSQSRTCFRLYSSWLTHHRQLQVPLRTFCRHPVHQEIAGLRQRGYEGQCMPYSVREAVVLHAVVVILLWGDEGLLRGMEGCIWYPMVGDC